ncbi:MAG: glycoside hydrolase family 15 protein [Candidatus Andersenbacteria bacterium]|nr:glycoside hydrolase family 15 protein [Candidatus Andersenbacteria bacterium]
MHTSLRDFALIGNQRTAALVSKKGSIDWLPLPWLDSPSVFARLLDRQGGHWTIQPQDEPSRSTQRYLTDTNIVTTTFITSGGRFTVTDFMPAPSSVSLLCRRITCQHGSCRIRLQFTPRLDFARGVTTLAHQHDGLAIRHATGRQFLAAGSPIRWQLKNHKAEGSLTLRAGEHCDLVLGEESDAVRLAVTNFDQLLASTAHFWRSAVREPVAASLTPRLARAANRSLLALKLLWIQPHSTLAAAPTTSLPEIIGGERNWDYRYNWLRDTGFALQSLLARGSRTEAAAYWQAFLRQAAPDIISDPAKMQCIYGLRWQRRLTEITLPHLAGYANSRPVRIGNGAARQRQWDNAGVLLDFIWSLYRDHADLANTSAAWPLVHALAEHVRRVWTEPDEGIWEVRSGPKQFVYSKVMCWVALDRAASLARVLHQPRWAVQWAQVANTIRTAVLRHGWSERRQSFTQSFGSDALDASLLRMPLVGFIDARDQRMLSTIDRIDTDLRAGDSLLLRYQIDETQDGLTGHEGAFLLTSFWMVQARAAAGQTERASELLDTLISLANHVGLYSEEIHPASKDFLGNFPQAYSHLGLLDAITAVSAPPAASEPISSYAPSFAAARAAVS